MINNKVLLIEDDRDVRDAIAVILSSEHFDVSIADNGLNALNQLRDNTIFPGTILLDLFMPEMNGLEFLYAFEEERNTRFNHLPIILMTAGSKDLRIVQTATQLVNVCIKKPLDIENLVTLLKYYSDEFTILHS